MTLVRNDPFLSSTAFRASTGGSPRPCIHQHTHTTISEVIFSVFWTLKLFRRLHISQLCVKRICANKLCSRPQVNADTSNIVLEKGIFMFSVT